jgi:DNA-binding response OmpR family regulator
MATVPLTSPPSSHAQLLANTILIVADEPLVALHLHSALREAGAGLIAATTADEALRLISRNNVSAAIVDVSLAGQDCYPVCKELTDRRQRLQDFVAASVGRKGRRLAVVSGKVCV